LAQDYVLKQLTASLMFPENDLGQKFWERVYARARKVFGTTEIPVNTFNKVWIVPDKAVVFERGTTAFVAQSHLKVMLEEDYVALQKNANDKARGMDQLKSNEVAKTNKLSSQVVKDILIPEIEKEVNEGKNFANLRQIYDAVILATWYKKNLKESLLGQVYVDQNKVKGIDIEDKQAKQKIYQRYLDAFKKGVYDFIKEEYDSSTKEMIQRRYFSGGARVVPGREYQEVEEEFESLPKEGKDRMMATVEGEHDSMRVRLAETAEEADALAKAEPHYKGTLAKEKLRKKIGKDQEGLNTLRSKLQRLKSTADPHVLTKLGKKIERKEAEIRELRASLNKLPREAELTSDEEHRAGVVRDMVSRHEESGAVARHLLKYLQRFRDREPKSGELREVDIELVRLLLGSAEITDAFTTLLRRIESSIEKQSGNRMQIYQALIAYLSLGSFIAKDESMLTRAGLEEKIAGQRKILSLMRKDLKKAEAESGEGEVNRIKERIELMKSDIRRLRRDLAFLDSPKDLSMMTDLQLVRSRIIALLPYFKAPITVEILTPTVSQPEQRKKIPTAISDFEALGILIKTGDNEWQVSPALKDSKTKILYIELAGQLPERKLGRKQIIEFKAKFDALAAGKDQSMLVKEVEGVHFDPALDFAQGKSLTQNDIQSIRDQSTRDNVDVRQLLLEALRKRKELSISGHLRGVDGPGSSLDLPEFQRALTEAGIEGFDQLPSTPTIASDFKATIRFELAEDPDDIVYVAPDYGITEDNSLSFKKDLKLNKNGRTKNGQRDAPGFIFRNIFGLTGIKIIMEGISPMALAGGMESSNVFNTGLIAAASMLSGANLTQAEIFSLAVKLENDEFGGLTGGQGHLSTLLGGAYRHMWTSGVRDAQGQLVNPYSAVSVPLLEDEQLESIENHMMLVQAGKEYKDGKAVVGRTAALVNNIWTDLLRDRDPDGLQLHKEKLGLTDQYTKALKKGDFDTAAKTIIRYVEIRDALVRRWLDLMLDADPKKDEIALPYARKYWQKVFGKRPRLRAVGRWFGRLVGMKFDEDYKVIKDIYDEKGEEGLRQSRLYSLEPIAGLVDAAKEEGIAIMPLGAGGPGANLIAVDPKGKEHLQEFLESKGYGEIREAEAHRVIRGTGTLKGFMPFKVGKDPMQFNGFSELTEVSLPSVQPLRRVKSRDVNLHDVAMLTKTLKKGQELRLDFPAGSGVVTIVKEAKDPKKARMYRLQYDEKGENVKILEGVQDNLVSEKVGFGSTSTLIHLGTGDLVTRPRGHADLEIANPRGQLSISYTGDESIKAHYGENIHRLFLANDDISKNRQARRKAIEMAVGVPASEEEHIFDFLNGEMSVIDAVTKFMETSKAPHEKTALAIHLTAFLIAKHDLPEDQQKWVFEFIRDHVDKNGFLSLRLEREARTFDVEARDDIKDILVEYQQKKSDQAMLTLEEAKTHLESIVLFLPAEELGYSGQRIVELVAKIKDIDSVADFRSWTARIAKNISIDHAAKHGPSFLLPEELQAKVAELYGLFKEEVAEPVVGEPERAKDRSMLVGEVKEKAQVIVNLLSRQGSNKPLAATVDTWIRYFNMSINAQERKILDHPGGGRAILRAIKELLASTKRVQRQDMDERTLLENAIAYIKAELYPRPSLPERPKDVSMLTKTLSAGESTSFVHNGNDTHIAVTSVLSGDGASTTITLKDDDFALRSKGSKPKALFPGRAVFIGDHQLATISVNDQGEVEIVNITNSSIRVDVNDQAMLLTVTESKSSPEHGGINLDAGLLDLQIKRDENGVPLPMPKQSLETINIDGFVPVIINITPVTNMLFLIGAEEGQKEPVEMGQNEADMPFKLTQKYRVNRTKDIFTRS